MPKDYFPKKTARNYDLPKKYEKEKKCKLILPTSNPKNLAPNSKLPRNEYNTQENYFKMANPRANFSLTAPLLQMAECR